MAFNPKAPPVPVQKSSGGKRHRMTPKQVAVRELKIAQAKENLTHADFNQRAQNYNDIYQSYHGGKLGRATIQKLINGGVSYNAFARYLTKLPAFYGSEVWKQNADKYFGPARDMGMKVNKRFVAKAIANSWDPSVFQEKLRSMPQFRAQYLQSNEFKTAQAGLTLKYQELYGLPNQEWQQQIQKAALGRWSPDQWVQKLRSLPEYTKSAEYQNNVQNLKQVLGVL